MKDSFRIVRQFAVVIAIALFLYGCGNNGGSSSDGADADSSSLSPDVGSAVVQVPVEERRIAIVHSQTSKVNFYDPFAYNQLFASVQHQAMMAGLPFDLLDEQQLAGSANLLNYDAIVIPAFANVKDTDRSAIVTRLLEAQQNGVGIITSGEFLGLREDGSSYADYVSAMVSVLGVQPSEFLNGVTASVKIADNTHPVSKTYEPGEEVVSYKQIWFANFTAASGEQSTPLTLIESDEGIYNGAQVIERAGRVVHFSNDQIMADNNQLWRIIQWTVYGDVAPVSLQVSRADHVFLARNDMDQAMIAEQLPQTEIPLLDIIDQWKRDFNFVGSYYIDIGNNPAGGEYTDWGVSGPLYQDYIAMGNEIATHSWTHPHQTSLLTAAELEFEFKDSAAEIGNRLGEPVVGAAVPGQAESLFVVETLEPWLDYLSGRTGVAGSGYAGAFGYLEPQHDMMYFSLNMAPDFTLIDFLKRTPADAVEIWRDEIDVVLKHAQTPLVHWLWHDYGPTTQTAAGLYTKEMFTDTIAYAGSRGAEFATVKDLNERMNAFAAVNLSVGSSGVVSATVDVGDAETGVGQFSLKVADDEKISQVQNWYAYSDNRVFLPDDGGEFAITLGDSAAPVTRITSLPMRARLMSLTGDGNVLNFTMQGEGEVSIALSELMMNNTSVTGAQSFVEADGVLTLQFDSNGTHVVELTPVTDLNSTPVATGGSVATETGVAVSLVLSGADADGDTLSFSVESTPLNGTLTGVAPDLTYTPNPGFTGTDSFDFVVSDGTKTSETARFDILVNVAPVPNTAPFANQLILESLSDQPLAIKLSGSDNENQTLSYQVTAAPLNGTLSGMAPDLVYTSDAGFAGRDTFEFVVNDSIESSAPGVVVVNVEAQLGQITGTVSNTSTGITVDGDLSDWSAITAFESDPQDITGTGNDIDWRDAYMSHDETDFYIAYREYGDADLTWGNQIYIDTDTDSSTGFKGFSLESGIGADFLIEGDALFRYFGDELAVQNDWFWEHIGNVEAVLNGDSVELKISRTQLENPDNVLLFFYGNSAATAGTALDLYPDNAYDSAAVLRNRRFSYSVNPNNVPDNFAPVAFAQRIQSTQGVPYPLTLTGFDQDGDPLEYIVDDSRLTGGTLTGTAPDLIYTPDGTTDSELIIYHVSDGVTVSNSRSIQIFLVPPPAGNNRPAANNLSLDVLAGSTVPVGLTGADADGDDLSYRLINPPVNGVLSGTAPDFTYTASGTSDSFTYVASDGRIDSSPATVIINVVTQLPLNSAPQAGNLSLTTAFETATGVNLVAMDADNDPLSYNIITPPVLGTLSGTAPQLTYIPFANVTGTDSFSWRVNDGTADSATATVVIDVQPAVPVNEAPVANGQSLVTAFAEPVDVVLSGRDADQMVLAFNLVTLPQGGVLSGTAPDLVYTPGANFSGADSFTFVVDDGELTSASATVTIEVGSQTAGIPVSNPVSSLLVDGSVADWGGLQSLGDDPADVGGVAASNPLDWRQAWVAHSATDLYIAYRNHEAFSLSWGHGIYVDTDGDINTGFRGFSGEFPIGADILLETDDVQMYTGSGNDWGWLTVAQSTVAVSGDTGELSLPLSAIGNPQSLRFYFRADNSAFNGNTVDHFPDTAVDATAPVVVAPAPGAAAVSVPRYLSYELTP